MAPFAKVVDGTGTELLAGPGLSGDQRWAVGARDQRKLRQCPHKCRVLANESCECQLLVDLFAGCGLRALSKQFGDPVLQLALARRCDDEVIDRLQGGSGQAVILRQDGQGGHENRIYREASAAAAN